MRKLSLILIPLLAFVFMSARLLTPFSSPAPAGTSPHGDDFKVSCDACHSSKSGWKLDKETYSFNHNTTAFALEGIHRNADCRQCHPTLKFKEAKTTCIDCHNDIHAQTVGPDCARCHTPKSWIVENITQIHQQSRFPLVGKHYTSDCSGCHKSFQGLSLNGSKIVSNSSLLRFDPLGTECYDCHSDKFNSATNPNHIANGYSKNCTDCHSMTNFNWGPNVNHSFFPLTLGHSLDCKKCHTNGTFSKMPMDCYSCHQTKYAATVNPNHSLVQFPTSCEQCHTTNPGWKPAAFNHTTFSLTLGHANVECNTCHQGNYTTTSRQCITCHQTNYNNATDPNHATAQFPTACEQCHTTNVGWKPASFDHTNFPLTSGHSNLQCSQCHPNGSYTNTSTVCYSCHQANYTATANPGHVALNFSTTCTDCHTTNPGWKPAQFTTHDTYFPIYSGKHNAPVWTNCIDCHTNTANYQQYDCIDCHPHNDKTQTDNGHRSVGGYAYNSAACFACHPRGTAEGGFNHSTSPFPLTGAHSTTPCASCHTNGYQNTSMICSDCHITAYNQTTNPNHITLSIPNTCGTCHTTVPTWKPATFGIHNNYYLLAGAHTTLACASCHNGNYNNQIPTDCYGCHQTQYNQTTNPPHSSAQFPTACEQCHTQTAWVPSTFQHDSQYFPIYSGKHNGKWSLCADCHTNSSNYAVFSCIDCHTHNQTSTNSKHNGVPGYQYNSNACYSCHPTGNSGKMMRISNPIRKD